MGGQKLSLTIRKKRVNISSITQHTYLFKAEWRNTSLMLKVLGKDEDDAYSRAWKVVRKLEGGNECLKITPRR